MEEEYITRLNRKKKQHGGGETNRDDLSGHAVRNYFSSSSLIYV